MKCSWTSHLGATLVSRGKCERSVSASLVTVSARDERDLIERVLRRYGVPDDAAQVQATWLLEGDLRGHGSHGIARLPVLVERIRAGLIDPLAVPALSWRSDSVLSVDGRRGLGPVVAQIALQEALARVASTGIVIVAVANANHLGILAPYVERAASRGVIAIALTTSEALVHPWGGRRAMVGTNPLAIAIPASPAPLVVDMATGEISMGKILHHRDTGEALQPGWALDAHGEPTTDPTAAALGSISPFGGAKGYALGLAFEVLVATLTASALGPDVHGTLDVENVCNKGDVFILIDPSFVAGVSIAENVTRYLEEVRNTPHSEGAECVRIPGERSMRDRERREREGAEVSSLSWTTALELAEASFETVTRSETGRVK
jgi:L-2-hydroxycarboxylate dehydrogenase (NAD+)